MKIRLVSLIGLTSLLLAGCANTAKDDDSGSAFSQLRSQACEEWADGISSATFQWMPFNAAKKFQQIAEKDSDYLQLSRAAFHLYTLNSTEIKYSTDAIKTLYIESISEVTRLCTSVAVAPETVSPSPSP